MCTTTLLICTCLYLPHARERGGGKERYVHVYLLHMRKERRERERKRERERERDSDRLTRIKEGRHVYNYTVHVVQRAHVHDALLLITHVVINNIIIKL